MNDLAQMVESQVSGTTDSIFCTPSCNFAWPRSMAVWHRAQLRSRTLDALVCHATEVLRTSAQHTRHIDRKLFKLREMRGAGIVKVQYIPTDENTADLFTKVLKRQPFEKHRKVVLNSGAGESTDEVKRQRVAALSAWKTKGGFYGFVRQTDEPAVPPWRAHVGGKS